MFVCISHGWADVCSTEGQKVLSLQDLKCQSWFWCFSLAQMSHLLTLIYFHRMKSFCLVKNMRGETKLMKRAVMLWRFCYTHSHAQHAVKWLAVLWLHVHLPVYIYIYTVQEENTFGWCDGFTLFHWSTGGCNAAIHQQRQRRRT